MKNVKFDGYNNFSLNAYLYDNVAKPRVVVQIIHGMQEYANRYDDFANFLNKNDVVVFVSDLRGHGKTAISENLQGFSYGDISEENILDQIKIAKYLKDKYENIPLIILGHSYGSFLTQNLIARYDGWDKAVLSGTTYTKTPIMKCGKIIANISRFFKGRKATAKLIEKMSFKNYAKGFENGNWLSRDENVWKNYQKDTYCGIPFPTSFYQSMFRTILKNYINIEKIPKDKPILIIYGTDDPVGEKGKGVEKLYNLYQSINLNVSKIAYPNGRHEMLNETNNQDVYHDLLRFFLPKSDGLSANIEIEKIKKFKRIKK